MFVSKPEAIKQFPLLAVGLSQQDIESDIYCFGYTEHQQKAAKLAEQKCGWHKFHILEVMANSRPPLEFNCSVATEHRYRGKSGMSYEEWLESCQFWSNQHRQTIENLAIEWAKEMSSGIYDRVFEPLCSSKSGLTISAHNLSDLEKD